MAWFETILSETRCFGCGECADADFCPGCAPEIERSPGPQALLAYAGPVRQALLAWKERHDFAAGRALFRCIDLHRVPLADVIVPVPPAFWRTLKRGTHPPDELARYLASAHQMDFAARALTRLDPHPQMGKNALARRTRTGPLFVAAKRAQRLVGKRVLIVDDVRTTGTTLREAEAALRAVGVVHTTTLALALAL